MPFYLRKSVKAGPFRFNFSSGGVGVSVGVKGLRVGKGPRGHYIHAGRAGLYYRASLGRPTRSRPARQQQIPALGDTVSGIRMVSVASEDVLGMQDVRYADVLSELNAKLAQYSKAFLFGGGIMLLGILGLLASKLVAGILFIGAVFAGLVGAWLDSYQRKAVLFYELDPEAEAAYKRLTDAFDTLAACQGKWHVSAGGAVQDLTTWKRNAGASHIVEKKPTSLSYDLPRVILSNVIPPMAKAGARTLYFFPDVMLIHDGKKIGSVSYQDLQLRWQDTAFIEEGRVPKDTQVIRYTWKHPNKNGGPDRRFAQNHQIPVCLYEVLHLTSGSGLNELLEFSRSGLAQSFAHATRQLASLNRPGEGPPLLPPR